MHTARFLRLCQGKARMVQRNHARWNPVTEEPRCGNDIYRHTIVRLQNRQQSRKDYCDPPAAKPVAARTAPIKPFVPGRWWESVHSIFGCGFVGCNSARQFRCCKHVRTAHVCHYAGRIRTVNHAWVGAVVERMTPGPTGSFDQWGTLPQAWK